MKKIAKTDVDILISFLSGDLEDCRIHLHFARGFERNILKGKIQNLTQILEMLKGLEDETDSN